MLYFANIRKGVTFFGDPFLFYSQPEQDAMARIKINKRFLRPEELITRWDCTNYDLQDIIEAGGLNVYVEPVVIKRALKGIPPDKYPGIFQSLNNGYLDYEDIYPMFENKECKIAIARIGDKDLKKILTNPLCVGFFDLRIPISQIKEFEFKHRNLEPDEDVLELLSNDFTRFRWYGKEYRFGELQAKVIKRLWQAWEDGEPWVYGKIILRDIGANSERIKSIFSHNKYWRNIIRSDRNGKYSLNVQPKQLSLFG